ncbi:MAG TPA: acetylxylan esterase [Armatimonadota bacterium]|jgi:dienelactone hydrolase
MNKFAQVVNADMEAGGGIAQVVRYLDGVMPRLEAPGSAEAWGARAEEARAGLLRLLLAGHPDGVLEEAPAVVWGETVETGAGYRVRKLRYEGYPGLWVPALLYEPTTAGESLPGVLNPEGHHQAGNALPAKQMRCINLAKRGMIALSVEYLGMGELSSGNGHGRVYQMDLCGLYGVGVFFLALKRGLDVLLRVPRVDPSRVAMTGCSGGGWQTMLLSCVDTRITTVVPVAGHSPVWQRIQYLPDIGDHEQLPPDWCRAADYDTMTALLAPRPCLLIYNHYDDCCFVSEHTYASVYERAKPIYELLGCPDNLEFHDSLFPRTHNYDEGNRARAFEFLERQFGLPPGGPEPACDDEILSEAEIAVGVPDDNATFLTLAREALIRCRQQRREARRAPVEERRRELAALLTLPELTVDRMSFEEPVSYDDRSVRRGVAEVGTWRLPLLEVTGSVVTGTAVVLFDQGWACDRAARLIDNALKQELRVLAVDLWGYGQNQASWQYHLLLEAAGERVLGLQVAQLLAVQRQLAHPCHLFAGNMVTPIIALAAAALAPDAWASVSSMGLMPSLDRLVEWPIEYGDCPSLFVRNLLTRFDIEDLLLLSAPVPVRDESRGVLRSQRGMVSKT